MTTLMIRNIPTKMSKEQLIRIVEAEGLGCAFDLVHLPCDCKKRDCSLGYAFVNVFTLEDVAKFCAAFDGMKWDSFSNSQKVRMCMSQDGFLWPN